MTAFKMASLLGKVPKQRALGQSHTLGNSSRCNVGGILFRRQGDQSPNRLNSTLLRWKVFRMPHPASMNIESN
jgi:hypothetical protein